MLGKIFGILVTVSFLYGAFSGSIGQVSSAVTSSAVSAVELSVSLLGSMCLWSGASRVLDKGGFTRLLQKLTAPFMRIVYPDSSKKNNGIGECAANMSANFLGLGNAALPTGIAAMKKLSENSKGGDRASDEMVMFAVLATTPFQLLPNTLAAMREAAGSAAPYEILLPVWICEAFTTVFAIIVTRVLSRFFK